jgi:hypothetical protein
MQVHAFLCCAVLCSYKSFDRPIICPTFTIKFLKGFNVSEGILNREQARGPNHMKLKISYV